MQSAAVQWLLKKIALGVIQVSVGQILSTLLFLTLVHVPAKLKKRADHSVTVSKLKLFLWKM